jgi:SAM-dependent methyltransferase
VQQPPIDQSQLDARISGHEAELLRLWQAEQGGAAKDRDLAIAVACLPIPREQALRAADLCCGPGDLGRAIWRSYPEAQLDFVDRDPLLLSICRGVNRLEGVPGTYCQLDLNDETWPQGLRAGHYDAIAVASALHWLSPARAQAVFIEIRGLLGPGGTLVLAEPARPEEAFAPGIDEWKARQPPRYEPRNWLAFWNRASELIGYDHTRLLGGRDGDRIGDGMTVRGWVGLAHDGGFRSVDVLWRDADGVIIAARAA